MKSNKIAVVMAQDLQSTTMQAACMTEIPPTLPTDVVIANDANLHKRTIPTHTHARERETFWTRNFNTHVNHK